MATFRWLSVAFLTVVLSWPAAAVARCSQTISSIGVSGFQEAVISVQDLEAAEKLWREVGGYERLCSSRPAANAVALWGVPETMRVEEIVLRKPNATQGLVRLVRFDVAQPQRIRSGAMPWDSGGIFDLYVYTKDVDKVVADLTARGWQEFNDPVDYTTGPFIVREAILRGPNGEVLCIMQLKQPAPDEARYGHGQGFGWPFNAALVVEDFEDARRFFAEKLGWKTVMAGEVKSLPGVDNPIGLPRTVAQSYPRRFASFTQDENNRDGSIQVLSYVGLEARNLSARATAPHRGLLALRVPVTDLDAQLAGFIARGGVVAQSPTTLDLPPYGAVKLAVLSAPGNARIELFQPQSAGVR